MDIEPWAAVVTAAVGSAGISGGLSGAIQFGRSARAARVIEQLMKSTPDTATGRGAEAAKAALDQARLRLAAVTLITQDRWIAVSLALAVETLLYVDDTAAPADERVRSRREFC
jgi:hypothetical protein